MSSTPEVREEILEPLRRSLRWLLGLRDAEGRIVCPERRIEHTGKSACAAVLAAELWRMDRGGERRVWLEAAIQQGRRLVARLEREGESECFTFRPGVHDPFNCSNNVIDGGACSDALATLVRTLDGELDAADARAFADASRLHARSYLRYAVLDKGVPAQRAWGLTGLAGAWSLEPDEELERAALEAIGALEGIQNSDGSYPYQPAEWSEGDRPGPDERGASDVSAFYQSRVTAFLLHALETLGRDPADSLFRAPLQSGLEYLCGLQGPDGLKCGLVEAKPWYWGATHEVASHPFDVYALARGWRHFGRAEMAECALRGFRSWAERLAPDGSPRSHLPGPGRRRSFQAPLFWAAHAMWLARAAPDLERTMARHREPQVIGSGIDVSVTWYPASGLARLEDGCLVAWVRGARPPCTLHHGSPHGAGLLRVVRKADLAELVARRPLRHGQEAEWSGRSGRFSAGRGWRSGRAATRFSLWLSRVHLRAGRPLAALATPPATLWRGVLDFASSRVGSPFELSPQVALLPDGVQVVGGLAHRDGTPVEGSLLTRTYQVDGGGLVVTEELDSAGRARGVRYRVPAAARVVEHTGQRIRYRLA